MQKVGLSFVIAILSTVISFSQENKFASMRNAFNLGLEQKGLELCLSILDNGSSSEKERAIFFIAEYSFAKIVTDQTSNRVFDINRALFFYKKYLSEFPNGKNIDIVQLRLRFIHESVKKVIFYDKIIKEGEIESYIIRKKLEYLFETLFTFNSPNSNKIFTNSNVEQDTQELLINYLDEIAVNYPNYELVAIYLKILAKLQGLSLGNYFSSNYLPYHSSNGITELSDINNDGIISTKEMEKVKNKAKSEVMVLLDSASVKYPKENLTLELHLIFAEIFMKKNRNDEIDKKTLSHLEYVLKNEENKLSLRYLLTKEFILNNKFEIKNDD